MTLKGLRPMLWTQHLKETVDFYTGVLGFTAGAHNDEWGWATLYRDGVEIMVALPNEESDFDEPAFTGSLYITTDDVDALWQDLKDKASIAYNLDNFEWGMREFAIYDNNGYILQFGQEITHRPEEPPTVA